MGVTLRGLRCPLSFICSTHPVDPLARRPRRAPLYGQPVDRRGESL